MLAQGRQGITLQKYIIYFIQNTNQKKKKHQTIFCKKFGYDFMKYPAFEQLVSPARIGRFYRAMNHLSWIGPHASYFH